MHTFSVIRDILFVTTTIILKLNLNVYCWFSHDVTKIQTTKLSILLRFYFHGVLEQLKTNFQTNFRFKRVLGFVIEYAWISKLLCDAAFTWRPRELSFRLKKVAFFDVKIIYDLRSLPRYLKIQRHEFSANRWQSMKFATTQVWLSIDHRQSMLINSN